MAQATKSPFIRCLSSGGLTVSLCHRCLNVVARALEKDLDAAEQAHECDLKSIEHLKSVGENPVGTGVARGWLK